MSSARTAKPAKARAKPRKPATAKTKPATAKTKPATAKTKTAPRARSQNLDDPTFQKVRALCLALPDTKLTMTWGSPHFRVADKIFCGFGSDGSQQVLGVKLERSHALRVVKEARFWPAPYVGKHGWVSLDVARRKSWDEVAALIRESYELIAPKASLAKLR
jgi:predicted DNA-binding protein (MmcQ/YjbR family)